MGAQIAARGTPTHLHSSHIIVGVVSLDIENHTLENYFSSSNGSWDQLQTAFPGHPSSVRHFL
jgi:hypothetical protein